MSDLACPFRMMLGTNNRNCIKEQCAMWIDKLEQVSYVSSSIEGARAIRITEAHCSFMTSPKNIEVRE